jgi:SAM-dependent methyltransferase
MGNSRHDRLSAFVAWVRGTIKGDEKGEAQIFLDRLFQAFAQKGCLEVGGATEFRIRKASEDGGGTAFADYVWKPIVLIEMKKRGAKLANHFRQAFDYWIRLAPNRPKYVVLSNFDEFWVYDFNVEMDSPVDQLKLDDLPERFGPLAFLFPTNEAPVFQNDYEAVTRKAADLLARCYSMLVARKVDRDDAQKFVLQMLVTLFAEDIGLLDKYFVTRILDECKQPADSFDLLGGLFKAMNTPGGVAGGRFRGVDYFNGGIFHRPVSLELRPEEVNQLKAAAASNWALVRPEIFGTLFEHSMEAGERHAFGAHFTSPVDIMKIVGPTIVEPWRQLIENADTVKRLNELLNRLHHYRVLDPACGSGNFLYIAYRELKRLEVRLYQRLAELDRKRAAGQKVFGFVQAEQFFGMDINPFAVELAKVTMMIGRKLSIDELHISESALPLDNLNDNFLVGDALITPRGTRTAWPAADAIIGNPPFLGAKKLKPERGADYVNAVRKLYPEVPGMADYCVYWLARAHDHLSDCTPEDPITGRAGLVGTQNIRNNKSREGGLDRIVASGTIVEAVDNQPWSGEANVHVSIANWVKHSPPAAKEAGSKRGSKKAKAIPIDEAALMIPAKRKLWFKVEPTAGSKKPRKRGSGPSSKEYELDFRETDAINSALSDGTDVSLAVPLDCNRTPQRCFQGIVTGYSGFVIASTLRSQWIHKNKENRKVVRPYLVGNDMLSGNSQPSRAIIDFGALSLFDAASYEIPWKHVKTNVLNSVSEKATSTKDSSMEEARAEHLERWWQFWNVRQGMRSSFKNLSRFIGCSRTTKRPVFCFLSPEICPDGKIQTFSFEDDYSYGVIQSHCHWTWFTAKCAKLTERPSYSARSVFDTLAWPQAPGAELVREVAATGREVRRVREEALKRTKGGLRAVYRILELPGKNPLKDAHAALDAAVLAAYNFSPKKDLLAQLLALNFDVAARIEAGQPVTAPGIPAGFPKPESLVTDDCIRPSE